MFHSSVTRISFFQREQNREEAVMDFIEQPQLLRSFLDNTGLAYNGDFPSKLSYISILMINFFKPGEPDYFIKMQ